MSMTMSPSMDARVLVLNRSYQPVAVTRAPRAFGLLCSGAARALDAWLAAAARAARSAARSGPACFSIVSQPPRGVLAALEIRDELGEVEMEAAVGARDAAQFLEHARAHLALVVGRAGGSGVHRRSPRASRAEGQEAKAKRRSTWRSSAAAIACSATATATETTATLQIVP